MELNLEGPHASSLGGQTNCPLRQNPATNTLFFSSMNVIEWYINMFVQIFCVLIIEFMSLLFPIVVCVSYLLLSRRLTVIKLILCNLSIPLSVCIIVY